MPALMTTIGLNSAAFIKGMHGVVDVVSKTGKQTASQLHAIAASITKSSETALAAGKSTRFYEAALKGVNAELARLAVAEKAAMAAAEARARTAVMMSRLGAKTPRMFGASGIASFETEYQRVLQRLYLGRTVDLPGKHLIQTDALKGMDKAKIDTMLRQAGIFENLQRKYQVSSDKVQISDADRMRAVIAGRRPELSVDEVREKYAAGGALRMRLDAEKTQRAQIAAAESKAAAERKRAAVETSFENLKTQRAQIDHEAKLARAANMRRYQNLRIHSEERAALAYQNSFMGRMGAMAKGIVGQLFGVYAVMRVFQSIKQFAIDAVQAQIVLQRIKNTLQSVSGSAVEAGKSFQFLLSESRRIGFSIAENADNFARFSIAAKNAGYEAKETQNVFTAVMEASAVMGLGAQRTSDALLALEQMLSKGKVQAEELRRQLGNAMPAAINIMARGLGMTLPQMYKALETGAIDASKAVKLFGLELQKSFTLKPEMNKTVRDLSRVSTEWFMFKAQFGKLVAPDLSSFLTDLREAVRLATILSGGGDNAGEGKSEAKAQSRWWKFFEPLIKPPWVVAMGRLAGLIDEEAAEGAKGKSEADRIQREADEIAALRAGAAPDQAARIAAVTAEVKGKEDLTELLLKELQIRNLLKEQISDENRIALQTTLGETELQRKRLVAEGAVEKARVDVEIAAKRKEDAAAAVTRAKSAYAGFEYRPGMQTESAKLEGAIKTAQAQLDAETLAEEAAQKALDITIAGEKPKATKGGGGTADVTEWQRLSAYAGGDTVMVNEAKLTNRTLREIKTILKTQRAAGPAVNYGD